MKKLRIVSTFKFLLLLVIFTFLESQISFAKDMNLKRYYYEDYLSISKTLKNDVVQTTSSDFQNKSASALLAQNNISLASNRESNQKTLLSEQWQFFIAPYFWFVGLNGDIAVNGQKSDVDASFGDIWDQLDFAFQIRAEASKNNYFFFIDETFMKLSIDEEIKPEFPIPIDARLLIEVKMNILEFGGGYRILATQSQIPVYLDLYTGGRWWSLDIDQQIKFANLPNLSSGADEDWFDFIVGTRIFVFLTENLVATVRTDIGGFDFGFSSKFSWNIIANIGYDTGWYGFNPYIGWRTMYVNYDNGSGSDFFEYKVWMNGIQAGLGFRF